MSTDLERRAAAAKHRRAAARGKIVAVAALCFSLFALLMTTVGFFGSGAQAQQSANQNVRPPETAAQGPEEAVGGAVPGGALGVNSDADLWRFVRGQEVPDFDLSTQDRGPSGEFLVQSEGDNWRALRNGPLPTYGLYGLGGMLGVLALFFLLRGRIRIEHGAAGTTIERFNGLERFGHWLLATSFIILALSGLNILYGRYFLPDLIGAEAFGVVSQGGKWAHNNVAWAFMLGLALVFFMWVGHNIPNLIDLKWIGKGGGLFSKGVHPDSRKFNAGQKLIFWSTIILGVSISMSGVALLFPFETAMMAKTFGFLNSIGITEFAGFRVDPNVTPMQEQQYQTIWHSIVSLAMIVVIIAHIYIGSVGMEGAFDAMGSGQVDLNWAKEHHNLWVDEVIAKESGARTSGAGSVATPAE